jgi:hypothetical protein
MTGADLFWVIVFFAAWFGFWRVALAGRVG